MDGWMVGLMSLPLDLNCSAVFWGFGLGWDWDRVYGIGTLFLLCYAMLCYAILLAMTHNNEFLGGIYTRGINKRMDVHGV